MKGILLSCVLLSVLEFATLQNICPPKMEVFIINVENLQEMAQAAEEARDKGYVEAEPFFEVELHPNFFNFDDGDELNGFEKSGTFITLNKRDKYIISSSKRGREFLVKFVIMETRYVTSPMIEFYARIPGSWRTEKVYVDQMTIPAAQQNRFKKTIFPIDGTSNKTIYSNPDPFFLHDLHISFNTPQETDDFGLQNLIVVTCIRDKIA